MPHVTHLVIGEAVVDVVTTLDGRQATHPGGGPTNVAYGLGRLGRQVTLLTELGHDANGTLIREHLVSAGVTITSPARARTATAHVVLGGGVAATYEFDVTWSLPEPLGRRRRGRARPDPSL